MRLIFVFLLIFVASTTGSWNKLWNFWKNTGVSKQLNEAGGSRRLRQTIPDCTKLDQETLDDLLERGCDKLSSRKTSYVLEVARNINQAKWNNFIVNLRQVHTNMYIHDTSLQSIDFTKVAFDSSNDQIIKIINNPELVTAWFQSAANLSMLEVVANQKLEDLGVASFSKVAVLIVRGNPRLRTPLPMHLKWPRRHYKNDSIQRDGECILTTSVTDLSQLKDCRSVANNLVLAPEFKYSVGGDIQLNFIEGDVHLTDNPPEQLVFLEKTIVFGEFTSTLCDFGYLNDKQVECLPETIAASPAKAPLPSPAVKIPKRHNVKMASSKAESEGHGIGDILSIVVLCVVVSAVVAIIVIICARKCTQKKTELPLNPVQLEMETLGECDTKMVDQSDINGQRKNINGGISAVVISPATIGGTDLTANTITEATMGSEKLLGRRIGGTGLAKSALPPLPKSKKRSNRTRTSTGTSTTPTASTPETETPGAREIKL